VRFAGGRATLRDAFRISLAGDLAGALAPTLVGGSAVKLVLFTRQGLSAGAASALVAWMTVEDALFFAVALPVGLLAAAGPGTDPVRAALHGVEARAGLVLGGAILVAALLGLGLRRSRALPRPLRGRLAATWHDARGVLAEILARGKGRAVAALGLTALQWLCRYSVVVAVLAAFGVRVSPLPHVLLQWVVFTAGSVVPTPGGAAAVESAFAVLYHPFVPGSLLAALTAPWRIVLFYLPLALDVALLGLLAGVPAQGRGSRSSRTPASATASNEVSSPSGTWPAFRTTLAPTSQASQKERAG
jgi:uncharacterized membrane protein YbhN (UPF0104 family)